MILLNFSHPLMPQQLSDVETLAGQPVQRLYAIMPQFDQNAAFSEQVRALADGVGLSAEEWQTQPILTNLPGYAPAAACLLAEIHGRTGHFPAIIRLRPVAGSVPTVYEVVELINLQMMRERRPSTTGLTPVKGVRMDSFLLGLLQNWVASFVGAIAAITFTQIYHRRREQEQFGGWTVVVTRNGKIEVERSIPVERAKSVLKDDSELSVYLKGIANAVGWINCDLVTDGYKNGMLDRNESRRILTINYDKNPKRDSGPTLRDIMNELQRIKGGSSTLTIDEVLANRGPDSEPAAAVMS